jgi:hypothetical protein
VIGRSSVEGGIYLKKINIVVPSDENIALGYKIESSSSKSNSLDANYSLRDEGI